MPDLTLIMPFFENAGMLARQYEWWAAWPEDLKARLEVILVDDGSPDPAIDLERPEGLPALRIYRVLENRPWHQHGARNLGAHEASDGWLLLTDMDHVLEPESARRLFAAMDSGAMDKRAIYMMDRIEADTREPTVGNDGNPKPHPNSFVVTKELFWKIGGYDEEYCGVYGTDRLFRDRAFTIGKRGHLRIPLVRYWRGLIPDASTNSLPRKEGREPGAKKQILKRKIAEGRENEILTLAFPWRRDL